MLALMLLQSHVQKTQTQENVLIRLVQCSDLVGAEVTGPTDWQPDKTRGYKDVPM